jgi:AcrR family transcriptional regulator
MPLSRKERERLVRESEILSAAENIFIAKGFESTTMDEIAKAAEFTKRTVYQYFISKENLFYGVIINGVKQLFSHFDDAISSGKTGFEKIQLIRSALYRFIKTSPDIYRLMCYAKYIKSDPKNIPNCNELNKLNIQLFSHFHQVIDEGIKDGSINPALNTPLGIFSLFFMTTGFMNKIFEAGENYSERYEINIEELVQLTFDLMDSFIQAPHSESK